MPAKSLKEYLVNIGWSSDAFGLKNVKNDIKTIQGSLNKLSATNVANIGSTILRGAIQLGSAVWNVVSGVAQADIEAKRFARTMWTSVEAAKSFQDASEITGMTWDNLFYATGEEVRHFMELKNLSTSLNAPSGLEDTLKLIRSINYEVDKFKLVIKQATRWVVYYFGIMNRKDLTDLRTALQDFNSWVIKNIPIITQKIALIFTILLKLGKAAINLFRAGKEILERFFGVFDKQVLGTAGVLTGFFALIKSGPVGWLIAALTAILLLIDDYTTWARGGHATLGALWRNMGSFQDFLDSKTIEGFGEAINDLLVPLTDLLLQVTNLQVQFWEWLNSIGAFTAIKDTVLDIIHAWTKALQGLDDVINLLLGRFDKISENSFLKKYLDIDTEDKTMTFKGGTFAKDTFTGKWIQPMGKFAQAMNPAFWGQMLGQNLGSQLVRYAKGNTATVAYRNSGGFGGNTTKSLQMNNDINININGDASGTDVGNEVVKSLDNYALKFSFK